MPTRILKFESGSYYHVYNRGCNRAPIFSERDNYLYFMSRIREYLLPRTASVVAYCLMPNHYHLLLLLHESDLSASMHKLSVSYSKSFNRSQNRVGPLFQGPFRAIAIDCDEYLLHLTRYLHLNPVSAGLVSQPEEWEFSSYREYIGIRNGTLPKPDVVLELIGSMERYREFVGRTSHEELTSGFEELLLDDE